MELTRVRLATLIDRYLRGEQHQRRRQQHSGRMRLHHRKCGCLCCADLYIAARKRAGSETLRRARVNARSRRNFTGSIWARMDVPSHQVVAAGDVFVAAGAGYILVARCAVPAPRATVVGVDVDVQPPIPDTHCDGQQKAKNKDAAAINEHPQQGRSSVGCSGGVGGDTDYRRWKGDAPVSVISAYSGPGELGKFIAIAYSAGGPPKRLRARACALPSAAGSA